MPGPLDVATARARLAGVSSGRGEWLGALAGEAGEALLVVDLDRDTPDGAATELAVPPLLPGVTVGVSSAAPPPGRTPRLDVLLTTAPHPPAPWVGVADLAAATDALAGAVAAHAAAAVALAAVLRAGRPDAGIEHDLLLESLAYSTLQAGPDHGAWLESHPSRRRPSQARGEPSLLVAREGDVLTITMHRPHVRNAYNAAMRDALCETLASALLDDGVAEVHWRAGGPDFCSGGDLDEFGSRPDPATAHVVRTTRSAARLLALMQPRLTAHLHGACVGAGIELPALAGRVLAAPDTTIRLPEVAMGLIPGAGGTASLPRRIGPGRTAWLALTGAPLDAPTALDWGLVDELTPPGPPETPG